MKEIGQRQQIDSEQQAQGLQTAVLAPEELPVRQLQEQSAVIVTSQKLTLSQHGQTAFSTKRKSLPRLPANGSALFQAVYGSEGANRQYANFCLDLATLLAGGMPAAEALVHASRTGSPALQSICESVAGQVSHGMPMHRAFLPYADQLPDLFLPILEQGERNGNTEQAVRRLAETFRKGVAVGHRFEYSVPGISSFFGFGATQFTPGRVSQQKRKKASDLIRLVLPLLGFAGRCFAGARWSRSFSALCNEGVPISSALELSARSTQNSHYALALNRAAALTRNGMSLREALAEASYLPPYLLDVIETGELTGDMGIGLEQLAEILEEDGKKAAAQALAAIIIFVLLVPALLFAIIAFVIGHFVTGH